MVLLIVRFESRTFCKEFKTWFLYLGQLTTRGLYSLRGDSLIPEVVHGALIRILEVIPRMVLTVSLGMRSLPYLRFDRPPVQAQCISMSWVAAPVCAMDVPNYYETCSGCAPRPAK